MNIFSSRRTVQTFSLDRLVEMAYDDWSSGRPPGLKKVDEKSETDAENHSMVKFKPWKMDRKSGKTDFDTDSAYSARCISLQSIQGLTCTLSVWFL